MFLQMENSKNISKSSFKFFIILVKTETETNSGNKPEL